MKNIRISLVISFLILFLLTVNADAKWWIFGQSNDEISINYMYINKISYDESGPEVTIYKETLQDGLIHINGKASVRKGKIGGVRVSTSNKERWEEAKFSENGAFDYSFRPEPDREYVLYIEIMDTAGKTNDIEATRKKIKLSDQNIMALIRETLDKMIEAYRNEDPTRFMSYVSDDFAGDESNLDRAIRKDFSAFDNIDLRYTLNNVAAGAKGMVYVSINFNRSVLSARDGKTYTDRGMTEFIFQLGPARVSSMKNPLIFGLSDAENVATGTVKSGSGNLNICLNSKNDAGLCVSGISGVSDSNVLTGTATLRSVNFTNFQGFIFADEEVTNETNSSNLTGDFAIMVEGMAMAFISLRTGVTVKDMGVISLNQITTADESGYQGFAQGPAGHSYVFKLPGNKYGAIEITSLTSSGMGGGTSTIRYKYQPNGTRNF